MKLLQASRNIGLNPAESMLVFSDMWIVSFQTLNTYTLIDKSLMFPDKHNARNIHKCIAVANTKACRNDSV